MREKQKIIEEQSNLLHFFQENKIIIDFILNSEGATVKELRKYTLTIPLGKKMIKNLEALNYNNFKIPFPDLSKEYVSLQISCALMKL